MENKNVELKVCVCVCVGGGGGTNIPLPPPNQKSGGTCPPCPSPTSYASVNLAYLDSTLASEWVVTSSSSVAFQLL